MANFKSISAYDIPDNMFQKISKEWALLTARDADGKINTMTISWGGTGHIWNRNVFTCVVRPQRYTFHFTESSDVMTLCFFGEEHRKALALCGSKSGRDCDKIALAGLTPIYDGSYPYFAEAQMVLKGKKLYADWLKKENFLDGSFPAEFYPSDDFHRVYICEITEVLIKTNE